MDVRFFIKKYLQKVSITSKVARSWPASLIKMNPLPCSQRIQTTATEKVGCKTACCRTFVSVENVSMASSNNKKKYTNLRTFLSDINHNYNEIAW